MSDHTPGLWTVEYDPEDGQHIIILAPGNQVQHRLEYDHGLYDDEDDEGPAKQFAEAEANAHLIAAAPQMYEALQASLVEPEHWCSCPVMTDATPSLVLEHCTCWVKQVHAALAAATVETE